MRALEIALCCTEMKQTHGTLRLLCRLMGVNVFNVILKYCNIYSRFQASVCLERRMPLLSALRGQCIFHEQSALRTVTTQAGEASSFGRFKPPHLLVVLTILFCSIT